MIIIESSFWRYMRDYIIAVDNFESVRNEFVYSTGKGAISDSRFTKSNELDFLGGMYPYSEIVAVVT